jgi:hypothetical protein
MSNEKELSDGKSQWSSPAQHRLMTQEKEIERLRGLLKKCVPYIAGWQKSRELFLEIEKETTELFSEIEKEVGDG